MRHSMTNPAFVEPSSPDIRTRQSSLIRSVLSIASKNCWPIGISLDVRASISNSSKVKRAKKSVMIVFLSSTSCLS